MKALRNLTSLIGYEVLASDSSTGYVDDFLFDDLSWKVRYMRLNMGFWRPGKRALISPLSIAGIDNEKEKIHLNLSSDIIRSSPDWDAKIPVSLTHELMLHKHYGWKFSVTHDSLITHLSTLKENVVREHENNLDWGILFDKHLQSINEIGGLHIVGEGGKTLGKLSDWALDDETWAIPFLMINLRNGKITVLDPLVIKNFNVGKKTIMTTLTDEQTGELIEYYAGQTAIVCVDNLKEIEDRLVHNTRTDDIVEQIPAA